MCRIVELCNKLYITAINSVPNVYQLYQLRDYVLNRYGYYAEIFYSENIQLWRFRIVNIKDSYSLFYSENTFDNKYDALREGVIKILEISLYGEKNEKRGNDIT